MSKYNKINNLNETATPSIKGTAGVVSYMLLIIIILTTPYPPFLRGNLILDYLKKSFYCDKCIKQEFIKMFRIFVKTIFSNHTSSMNYFIAI